ncbi:UbiD family decarboxylase [Chloroflexota bacterium]
MVHESLRDWIEEIEAAGEIKHITAEVDWNLEAGAIARKVANEQGPALLFENIKDHKDTVCHKLLLNCAGSYRKTAMALGLPPETSPRGIVEFIKEKVKHKVAPIIVDSGPVKQNIVKGDAVNLFEFPVPKYNPLDGGRYINTRGCQITMDPDTKVMNVGLYRGMIGENGKSIPSLLVPTRHWGQDLLKYASRGEEMPCAVVYGWDPILAMVASSPVVHPDFSEYETVGALRGKPVELVKCELSDLYVPASAEIVVEGWVSADPKTFEMEGSYGEYPGFYGGLRKPKHVIRVECVTYRDEPIFHGGLTGYSPGRIEEAAYWHVPFLAALTWSSLEELGIPNITGVWGPLISNLTNCRISIDKIYRGHARQLAAALWGLKGSQSVGKNLTVVDKDIDVFDDDAVDWAIAYRTNAELGAVQIYPGTPGGMLDPSTPLPNRDVLKYGQGTWARVLIDATVNWKLEPEEQYGGKREPPLCTQYPAEINELVDRRWKEYGL